MPIVETTGETVSDERAPSIQSKDVPIYTVSKAVEWMKRPENQAKVEKLSKMVGEATRQMARDIDREVTKVGRQFVEIATDENAKEDYINAFLKTLIGED